MSNSNSSVWDSILDKQFAPFTSRITSDAVTDTQHEATESIRVVIKNNRIDSVTRNFQSWWSTRIPGYLTLIEDALKVCRLPDVDFLIAQADLPISNHRPPLTDIPVFSFCKTENDSCIMFPFHRFSRDNVPLDFRWNDPWGGWASEPNWDQRVAEIEAANGNHTWEEKDPRCLFAGHSDSWNGVRIKFFEMSLDFPDKLLGDFLTSPLITSI